MRKYILDFLEAAEVASVNASGLVARGDKNKVDEVAVNGLRQVINQMPVSVNVVTGEGVIDNAPLLAAGEILGSGGTEFDMAVGPVDGTTLAANGQPNSLVSLAIAPKGELQPVPDMYMEKMICSVPYVLDLECSIEHNLRNVANALIKPMSALKVVVLNKSRHKKVVEELRKLNVKVHLINDGDILATLDVMRQKYDFLYSIGGAPEGIISACICKALRGDMTARLVSSSEFKQTSADYIQYEQTSCTKLGLNIGEILPLSRLVKSEEIFTILTAVTDCVEMKAPEINEQSINVQSVIVEGKCSSITYTNEIKMNNAM